MKTPTFKYVDDCVVEEICALNNTLQTKTDIERFLCDAIADAEAYAKRGHERLQKIQDKKRRQRTGAWEGDSVVTTYFGSSGVTRRQIRITNRRMLRTYERLRDNTLRIRLRSQAKDGIDDELGFAIGRNRGAFFSNNTFVLFPRFFGPCQTDPFRAAVLIHELLHDWLIDRKVEVEGERVPVYGDDRAKRLAADKPRRSRKSPENYSQFCWTLAGDSRVEPCA